MIDVSNMSGHTWRETNAIYQLYIRSFMDSNADGIGDLRGAISKLDYLAALGVEAIWLTPFYPSGGVDGGYDVTDFYAVDDQLGTMHDLEEFIEKAHGFGMKVMIDVLLNHTSNQHAWFLQSRLSKDNPKSDWYIWRDQPNNWQSKFGGSMWSWDESRQQYYLHTFFKEQPDLNWQNPEVRREMHWVFRYWFDKGVDGMRVDAAIYIAKDFSYADNEQNPDFHEGHDPRSRLREDNISYGDDLQAFLQELTDIAESYNNKFLVFEAYPEGRETTLGRYRGLYSVNPKVSAPLMLESTWIPFSPTEIRQVIGDFQSMIDPERHIAVYCIGNHDRPRVASRFGQDQARIIACLQLTLPGVPIVYYGEEIGMENGDIPVELRLDGAVQAHFPDGRDSVRTPLPWNDEEHYGFTTGTPWLPAGKPAGAAPVAMQIETDNSMLRLYQRLLELRKIYPALRVGSYATDISSNDSVLVFVRSYGKVNLCIALNFTDSVAQVALPFAGNVILSTTNTKHIVKTDGKVLLKPFEGVIVESKHKHREGGR